MGVDDRLAFFNDNFDVIAYGSYSRGQKKFISGGEPRVCRFCHKSDSETTFRNESHAIPECLGNHQLIALDECDTCNRFFSKNLEDNLDKFTKPYRVAGQIHGKNGVPNYRTNNKLNRIEFGEVLIIKSRVGETFVQLDQENKQLRLTLHQEPHIPLAVYKAILKIAVSIIEDAHELEAFKYTIDWLLNPDLTISVVNPATLWQTFVPGPRPTNGVAVCLLRRKVGVTNIPYSIFVIAFGNIIFQVMVPSHLDNGRTISCKIPYFPSPFELSEWQYGGLKFTTIDLSSTTRVSGDLPLIYSFQDFVQVEPPQGESC